MRCTLTREELKAEGLKLGDECINFQRDNNECPYRFVSRHPLAAGAGGAGGGGGLHIDDELKARARDVLGVLTAPRKATVPFGLPTVLAYGIFDFLAPVDVLRFTGCSKSDFNWFRSFRLNICGSLSSCRLTVPTSRSDEATFVTRRISITIPPLRGFKTAVRNHCNQHGIKGYIRFDAFLQANPCRIRLDCVVQGRAPVVAGIPFSELANRLMKHNRTTVQLSVEEYAGVIPRLYSFGIGRTPTSVAILYNEHQPGAPLSDGDHVEKSKLRALRKFPFLSGDDTWSIASPDSDNVLLDRKVTVLAGLLAQVLGIKQNKT